jgi:hypothetical protein
MKSPHFVTSSTYKEADKGSSSNVQDEMFSSEVSEDPPVYVHVHV